MKHTHILHIALAALMAVVLSACKSSQSAQGSGKTQAEQSSAAASLKVVQKVADNAHYAKAISSKIKFSVKFDDKDLSVGGSLKMKRDEVIRLQLTAFGLMEVGRMEFTKDYVLVMDRINKQYIKVDYSEVDFLKQSGLNFYSLQALFWNELFLPGQTKMTDELLKQFAVSLAGAYTDISHRKGALTYDWQADKANNLIQSFRGTYDDSSTKVGIQWNYADFTAMDSKKFPTRHSVTVNVPGRNAIKVSFQLSSPTTDADWESRTEVSSKYKRVELSDILSKLSAF